MTLRDLAHHVPYHHELYVVGLTLVGRNRCSLVRALRENSIYRRRHEAAKASIGARSRVLERRPDGLTFVETPYGKYWKPSGMDLFSPLAEREVGLYTSEAHAVQPDDIVLDCGANVGVFVAEALERAARVVVAVEPSPQNLECLRRNFAAPIAAGRVVLVDRGARVVVAVEPSPQNLECLRRNFAAPIAAGRVVLVDRGVWDKEETLRFAVSGNSVRDSFVLESGDEIGALQLRVTTIDRLRAELALPRIDFIKMDIEGAEQQALAGAQDTLARFHPRLSLAAYHRADDFEEIPRLVNQACPAYSVAYGPCTSTFGHVQPETFYFSAPAAAAS